MGRIMSLSGGSSGGGSVTGSGAANQVAYWTGTSVIAGDADFTFDGTNVTVTNPMFFANGTAAAPSVASSTNPTTGIYFSAGGSLLFSTGGTSRGNINSTGSWTIGTVGSTATHNVEGDVLLLDASSSTGEFAVERSGTTGNLGVYGGASGASGRIALYGSTHATKASRFEVIQNTNITMSIGVDGNAGFSGGFSSDTALGIGTPSSISGTTQYGVFTAVNFSSSATTEANVYYAQPRTAAAAFTLPLLTGYRVVASAVGGGSTVTRLVNYFAPAPSGATNNSWAADNSSFSGDHVFSFTSTRQSAFAGALRSGNTGVISYTNEQISGRYVAASGDAAVQNAAGYFQYSNANNTVFSSTQNGLVADLRRTITSPITDTGTNISALSTNLTVSASGTTYTTARLQSVLVTAPSVSAGTLSVTTLYSGLKIETSTAAIGTRKTGLFIDTQSGATNNAFICDNEAFTGSFFISSTSTNVSSFGGQMQGPNGTVSAPTWSFTNATGTGLYRGAANQLDFATSGANRGTIGSTGTWTIGSSGSGSSHTLNGATLSCVAAGSTTEFAIERSVTTADLGLYGGGSSSSGRITLYGSTHASQASVTQFVNGGTVSGSISAAQLWSIGNAGGTNSHVINGFLSINTGASSSTNILAGRNDQNANTIFLVRNDNTGASATSQFRATAVDDVQLVANSSGAGSTADLTANSGFTGGLRIAILGSNSILFRTNSTERASISGAGAIVLGSSGTTEILRINSDTATAGTDILTFTNGPSGTAGNPDLYIRLNFNGTTYVVPAFAF